MQIDRTTGIISAIDCGHLPSSITTRARAGTQVTVCGECEKVGAQASVPRAVHVLALREYVKDRKGDDYLRHGHITAARAAIKALLPELERAETPWAHASMDSSFMWSLDLLCEREDAGCALTAPKASWLALREILNTKRVESPPPPASPWRIVKASCRCNREDGGHGWGLLHEGVMVLCIGCLVSAPPAREWPTVYECVDAYLGGGSFAVSHAGVAAVRALCAASHGPKVEWPEWLRNAARAGAAGPFDRYIVDASPAQWSDLLALMEKT